MGEELFPPELRKKATSVIRELGHRVSRVEFTRSLLKSTETWYDATLPYWLLDRTMATELLTGPDSGKPRVVGLPVYDRYVAEGTE